MHNLLSTRKLLFFAVTAVVMYLALVAFIPGQALMEILNGVFLGIVATVSVVFFPLFIRSLKAKEFDRVSQLTIGIILTWFSLILSRVLAVYVNATDHTMLADFTQPRTVAAYLAILGGILHVTAPGMVDNRWKYNRRLLTAGVAVGCVIALITILIQKDGMP